MLPSAPRFPRLPSWRRFLLFSIGLGLAPACLNPDISDEPPLSESAEALETADAGSLEEAAEAEPLPAVSPAPRGRRTPNSD